MIRSPLADAIQERIVNSISRRLGVDSRSIDVRRPFAEHGLSSLEAVSLVRQLAEELDIPIPATATWDYPTIERLSLRLASDCAPSQAARLVAPSRDAAE